MKPGLTKLWRASLSREREGERESEGERARERELRLAANLDPPVSASQSTGITSVRHHARPLALFLYFILRPGLTKLWRASLSRERETERERERERGRERQIIFLNGLEG